MTGLQKRKKRRQQEALQRVIDVSERLGLYRLEDEALAANQDALAAIRQYCLTGRIEVDAELLRAVGFRGREADQVLAANQVRIAMRFYSFGEELTIDNAERLLVEHQVTMRGGETG